MQKINETLSKIEKIDYSLGEKTQERLDNLTKPQGSLGRLEELAKLIVSITKNENPGFKNKVIFTMAADHGIAEENVSAFPQEVTQQMVYNFIRGGAGINVLAKHAGARVIVVDMGVVAKIQNPPNVAIQGNFTSGSRNVAREIATFGTKSLPRRLASRRSRGQAGKIQNFKDRKINYGTKNMSKEPAMTKDEAVKSIETGIELFEDELSAQGGKNGIDIVGIGEMGIGNTTSSSAIAAVITGKSVEDLTGRGTGIDAKVFANKINVIKNVLKLHKPDPNDSIDILSKVGGFEIGGLAGIILAAASKRIPVVLDGFISGASALIAYVLEPKVKDYMIASHCSVERGHKIVLDYMGLKPLLDLNLRLGEGTGAALAISIVEASIKILTQMATFKNAGVSERADK